MMQPLPAAYQQAITPAAYTWTRQQDKLLELLIHRLFPQWGYIAAYLGGDRTPYHVSQRWEFMVAFLRRILDQAPEVYQAALCPRYRNLLPALALGGGGETAHDGDSAVAAENAGGDAAVGGGNALEEEEASMESNEEKKTASVQTKNKPMPWSEDEHKQFLAAIKKYGKGGWQRVSSEFVPTRTASQIASHYQKYTIRQAKRRRNECKRPSIHDIEPSGSGEQPAADKGEDEGGTADDSVAE